MVQNLEADVWDAALASSEKPLVVEFWHDGCIWCKKLGPLYDALSSELSNATFAKFNILSSEENEAVGQKYGIMGTPTIKVFCKGIEVGEVVGFMGKEELRQNLEKIIKNSDSCARSTTPLKK